MQLSECKYWVVEGAIGVGKTTLAKLLSRHLGADTLLEAPQDNPFLPQFYQDPARYALATQMTYLFQRADQLNGLAQRDLFSAPVVADFMLDKDPLFARLTLSDQEFSLYTKMYQHLRMRVPTPDVVLFLQASPETLYERIRRRGHAYERPIDVPYLRQVQEAYHHYFFRYSRTPMIAINTENLNFAESPVALNFLLQEIAQLKGQRLSIA
ncbi:MAG: hypothetical protein RLZZ502_719 [Pseudomonadota bacterium]